MGALPLSIVREVELDKEAAKELDDLLDGARAYPALLRGLNVLLACVARSNVAEMVGSLIGDVFTEHSLTAAAILLREGAVPTDPWA